MVHFKLALSFKSLWCLNTNAYSPEINSPEILPMPDLVDKYITSLAESFGHTRGIDPDLGSLEADNDDRDDTSCTITRHDGVVLGPRSPTQAAHR